MPPGIAQTQSPGQGLWAMPWGMGSYEGSGRINFGGGSFDWIYDVLTFTSKSQSDSFGDWTPPYSLFPKCTWSKFSDRHFLQNCPKTKLNASRVDTILQSRGTRVVSYGSRALKFLWKRWPYKHCRNRSGFKALTLLCSRVFATPFLQDSPKILR